MNTKIFLLSKIKIVRKIVKYLIILRFIFEKNIIKIKLLIDNNLN